MLIYYNISQKKANNRKKGFSQTLKKILKIYRKEKEKTDAITHWNDNIRFHLAFFELYGNQYAYQLLRSAMSLQTRAYAQTRWEEYHTQLFYDVPTIHGSILEAIRQNDQDKAVSLLKTDIYSI